MRTLLLVLLVLTVAAPASAQVFTVDGIEPSYTIGDTIFFTLTNHSDQQMYFGGAPEYCIYNVALGCQWMFLAIVVDFPPGAVLERSYDTGGWDDNEPGQYRISSTCVEGDWMTEHTVEIDFLLVDPVDTDEIPLGGLKTRYR